VMIAAANADPKANEAAATLDLERHPNRHIAFGTGIHFCLGYQLARLEGKCALEALFKRWPKLALAIPAEQITWRPRPGLRAIERLLVVSLGLLDQHSAEVVACRSDSAFQVGDRPHGSNFIFEGSPTLQHQPKRP